VYLIAENKNNMNKKNMLFKKIACFLFLFAILFFSAAVSFVQAECGAGFESQAGVCIPSETGLPNPSGGIVQIITNIMYWILGIFGVLAVIAFVIAGIQYILSVGDEKAIDTAKRSMKWSIVGVAVALSGLIIIYAIDGMFSATPNF
jgi:lysylphosphatidylglycerol synthetase-like protein (DUF2156 family)